MFGSQQDPSKTEEATPKRRKKQREEGNVPRSQEASKCVSLVAGLIGLSVWTGVIGQELMNLFREFISKAPSFVPTQDSLYGMAIDLSVRIAVMVMPFMLFLALCSFLVIRLQVGKLWTTKVFKFRWDRFNIFKSLKQMFLSPMTVFRLLKSVAIAFIIGLVPGIFLWLEYPNFLPVFYATPTELAAYMLDKSFEMACWTLPFMIVIAALDIWQTRYAYNEGMKMTKEEVKDERKQQEGDEKVKAKQKQKMLSMMTRRMLQDVPKADVVVTNPTHFAVALSYNPMVAPAPIVLAKGADKMAQRIKDIARESRVPIRENVALARALYASCQVGDSIPEDLYKATAALLASIWRMQGRKPPAGPDRK